MWLVLQKIAAEEYGSTLHQYNIHIATSMNLKMIRAVMPNCPEKPCNMVQTMKKFIRCMSRVPQEMAS